MEERVKNLEAERHKLQEKWVRVSARQKVEERNKSKVKDKEQLIEKIQS